MWILTVVYILKPFKTYSNHVYLGYITTSKKMNIIIFNKKNNFIVIIYLNWASFSTILTFYGFIYSILYILHCF